MEGMLPAILAAKKQKIKQLYGFCVPFTARIKN
ncbi:hypothetical protein [Terrilactibacillus laevilacticus]